MEFDFHILVEDTHDKAVEFFKNLNIHYPERASDLELLRVVSDAYKSVDDNPLLQKKVKSQGIEAFKAMTGKDIHSVAHHYDPRTKFDEDATDMMPRQEFHTDRTDALGWLSADDVMKTDESIDPNSFENTGHVYATREDMIKLGQGAPSPEAMAVAQATMVDATLGAIVVDPEGNTTNLSDMGNSISQIDTEWFNNAAQTMYDQTLSGGCICGSIEGLAREFATFFDQSYEAFEFAIGALSRKAAVMGILEDNQSVRYHGKTVMLESTGPIKILNIIDHCDIPIIISGK